MVVDFQEKIVGTCWRLLHAPLYHPSWQTAETQNVVVLRFQWLEKGNPTSLGTVANQPYAIQLLETVLKLRASNSFDLCVWKFVRWKFPVWLRQLLQLFDICFFRSIRCHAELPNHLMLKFAGSICFSFQRTGVAKVFCIKIRVFNDQRVNPHPTLGSLFSLEGSPCLPGEPNWNENIVLSQTNTTFHHQQPSGWWLQNHCSWKETCGWLGWHLFASFSWQFSSWNAETFWLWLPHAPYHLHPCYALVAGSLLLAPAPQGASILSIQKLNNKHAGLPRPTTWRGAHPFSGWPAMASPVWSQSIPQRFDKQDANSHLVSNFKSKFDIRLCIGAIFITNY